jgi:hypothetical protein
MEKSKVEKNKSMWKKDVYNITSMIGIAWTNELKFQRPIEQNPTYEENLHVDHLLKMSLW